MLKIGYLWIVVQRILFAHFVSYFSLHFNSGYFRLLVTQSKFSGTFVVLLFYVHGKHLRSCRYGQLT